jgi:hypothetical protein
MNDYWKEKAGLTHEEKQAFVDRARADEAKFLRSLRKITDQAENRMRTRTARQQHHDALRELNRGPDDVVPDAHPEIQRDMLK